MKKLEVELFVVCKGCFYSTCKVMDGCFNCGLGLNILDENLRGMLKDYCVIFVASFFVYINSDRGT